MKLIPASHELITNMKNFFRPPIKSDSYRGEEPIRAQLLSGSQMEYFGKSLAGKHKLSTKPAEDHLLLRLADNENTLSEVRKLLTDSIKKKFSVTPAGEWLIDNFYLIEENIRIAKINFPKKYSEDLPQLSGDPSRRLTRIYDIVIQLISHSDGKINLEILDSFIKAYQTVTNLTLGELWAIPIMIRLALIENIRRIAAKLAIDKVDGYLADYWATKMIKKAESDPKNLLLEIADMSRSNPPISSAFVSELTRQLRGKGSGLALALNWVEQQLSESGLTSNDLINEENQKQAANQVSISNSIGSLRWLGTMDWRTFVETNSIVEQTLREDNNGIYGTMDFFTRDRYRHVVEYIAKKSKITEHEVARIAIQLMHENTLNNIQDCSTSHVGYYLIGEGVSQTKKLAKMRLTQMVRILDAFKKNTLKIYLGSILLITISISAAILTKAYSDTQNTWLLLSIAILLLLSLSQFAIAVVNFISTLLTKPHLLPRMDFSKAIPPEFRTIVIIPAILNNTETIDKLVESLEIHFLANRNQNLHFGLLTDFVDATLETLPEDQALIASVKQKIKLLNKKYHREKNDLFYLFHRPRFWNPSENAWMGYERKRGKLAELNSLLRGNSEDRFSLITGDQSIFSQIKYVITLDADTQLPLETAWKLVGTLAHPLNHAWYNEKKQRVTKGYGILQPRVTVSLPDKTSSIYTRLHGNEPGLDPYTRASSDVYQDLFGEGSFIGKGIYEIDTFIKALGGRFSENTILSHDLLEGCYLRSGLVSDVQLFEKYPVSYQADRLRYDRWIRGDWQIFAWFLALVPGKDGHRVKNPISTLSRWKIFDNLRRSLIPAALTMLILLGWIVLHSSTFWTLTISGIIVAPIFITSFWDTIRKPKGVILAHHIKNSVLNLVNIFLKTLIAIIVLPYEAFSNLKTISISLWRMIITRKKMLEWNQAHHSIMTIHPTLSRSYSSMWFELSLASSILIFIACYYPEKTIIAGPVLLLWIISPFVTWWISKPMAKQVSALNYGQNIFLHKLARKTWSFFERFVDQEDNWLPPDNFQEQPVELIAHRTSPTNIGLSLLANLSAHDFGYITTDQFIERTAKTVTTLEKMERYKSHFYNWYDTKTLAPLIPKYISTVDSGNLVGHLLILTQGLLEIPHQTILGSKLFDGLRDTLFALKDTLAEKDIELLQQFEMDIEAAKSAESITLQGIKLYIDRLTKSFAFIFEKLSNEPENEIYWWKQTLKIQLKQVNDALQIFSPWLLLTTSPLKFTDLSSVNINSTLDELLSAAEKLQGEVNLQKADNNTSSEAEWLEMLINSITESISNAQRQINSAEYLAWKCKQLSDVEWDFLYDESSNLFTIGFSVQENRMDASFYDLLASEARLCTYIGIAQGKLPEASWFALGRLLTNMNGNSVLLSWSGSMFEYLMPLLVMPTFENTLLDQTYKSIVNCQALYRKQTGRPWGISESGYNMINAYSQYQYRAFGYHGLGLKRGLDEDAVIAPYASVMALMVAPEKACENLELLSKKGLEGRYGFYEAIDYTPSRLHRGKSSAIVYSFMAHHQGMSLLSFSYLLHDKPMQRRFESDPQFKAILLLLQERIPKTTTFFAHTTDIEDINYVEGGADIRIINTPNTAIPEVQLLSNGNYHVMITNSGAGYSRWRDIAVTRWREDVTCDNWGTFCYIQDLKTKEYWSSTHQPTGKKSQKYQAAFSQGRADFHTTYNEIETHTEIVVSPEDDIEMRRVRITNSSGERKTIEVTSYAEIVITHAASDLAQPAFNNLFVQTEILPVQHAILCTRRPKSVEEKLPYMFHMISIEGKQADKISYETNRMKFIGRGNTIVNPQAMNNPGPLSGTQGSVLDPIVAIRYKITLEPDDKVTVDMVTGIAETKENCKELIDKYHDRNHKQRVFELAWTHSQVVLRQINATEAEAQLYCQLASSILFATTTLRADPSILIINHRQQSGLWGYSISGDLPIVLLKIEKQSNMGLAKQLIQAHAYWRTKGLLVDLVIWNEEHSGYRRAFQTEIESLIPPEFKDRSGGIFVRASDQISNEDRILFQSVARVSIDDNGGTLTDHINRKTITKIGIPYITRTKPYIPSLTQLPLPKDLVFFNGLGGFSSDGNEYIITIDNKNKTPVPWVNVIANPNFGTVISESGSAYTWLENAHELRLSPWNNDPVSDKAGEAFYLRDEESGHFWSPTLLPAGGPSNYITRHGFGYSSFEHIEDGIYSEMLVYVDLESSVKFTVLKIRNQSGRHRKLSATGYTEWVLGDNRMKTAMHIQTEVDPDSSALFAKNQYNTEFSNRVAFFDVDFLNKSFTTDRTEFIGRNGTLQNPKGLRLQKLSGRTGAALDPCAAIQVPFEIADGEEQEIIFRLGAGKDIDDTRNIVKQFKGYNVAHDSFELIKNYWKHTLGALQVETPDAAINIITNGWLTYQTLSSRLWARSGFYQSGGAFGFRDQLQDVLSLLHTAPQLARKQIVLCASRQFKEGDVQHWWHPPIGRGVRTRISDDFLWLPYVTSFYILHTGDTSVLDESAPYLEGRPLNAGEESYYDLPVSSAVPVKLYDHCIQSIRHGFNYGTHGLPLIGSGDWNDGYNKVGDNGKGESVWLAFFLYDILIQFEKIVRLYNDSSFADECIKEARLLKENIDKYTWDGEWYKRAWFDNGTPLGSASNEECKIDSIVQSWSVLSCAGDSKHRNTAMESAYKKLVIKDERIIKLLDPPFDKSDLNPGYIKGYVPGIRENGGQYTHAAIWMIMAFAKLGDNKRVWELLNMINPINHGQTSKDIEIYKVEPYVIAADVYAGEHAGRGGWTWYTGSAGWMYRLIVDSFLGLLQEGNKLKLAPCIPDTWESFKIHYRYKTSLYHIEVIQQVDSTEMRVTVDGQLQADHMIMLVDDGAEHHVRVIMVKPQTMINA